MAKDGKRLEAERLYVKEGLSCPAVAERLGVNGGTVYRWKAEAASAGEAADWDGQRRVYNISPLEIFGIYAESVKAMLLGIKKNPKEMLDAKTADTMAKHVAVLQKIDPRSQCLGVALDLIETASRWLAKNQPDIKERLDPYWENIYQALVEYVKDKGHGLL